VPSKVENWFGRTGSEATVGRGQAVLPVSRPGDLVEPGGSGALGGPAHHLADAAELDDEAEPEGRMLLGRSGGSFRLGSRLGFTRAIVFSRSMSFRNAVSL